MIAIVGLLLVGNELWSRRKNLHEEFSRKFIHISVGCLVAFWPWWLSWTEIRWLSVAFLAGVGLSKLLGVFQALHSVQRPTWGEFFFAISVGGLTFLTHNKWIYATALLQMALADGLAAVIGVRYGNGQGYSVFGHRKTLIGTLVFLLTSMIILVWYQAASGANISIIKLDFIALLASAIENLAVAGFDNLLVPLVVVALLR